MVLHMEKGGLIPIGGFPRNLLKDYPGTYRRKKRPPRDSRAASIDATQTYRDFRLQIEDNLAASRWRSRFVTRTQNREMPRWSLWARTAASTAGDNSEAASVFSDSDISISDSDNSVVVRDAGETDSEDEEVPSEEARQNVEQSKQDGKGSPRGIKNFTVDSLHAEGDGAPASTAGAER
ncbi:uncharacterized protein PAC_06757 [Phialocephala subalpina]|uniref:Uncharacterized protein n=1 Tax=Phialocephala subalpina TaxID=576137 RepID=A0A1L7WVT3_9HELO|nr:uncharacterized protein PAC_06757 [Phialocephala subalpina]